MIENEFHFVFYCEVYNTLFNKIKIYIDSVNMDDAQELDKV